MKEARACCTDEGRARSVRRSSKETLAALVALGKVCSHMVAAWPPPTGNQSSSGPRRSYSLTSAHSREDAFFPRITPRAQPTRKNYEGHDTSL